MFCADLFQLFNAFADRKVGRMFLICLPPVGWPQPAKGGVGDPGPVGVQTPLGCKGGGEDGWRAGGPGAETGGPVRRRGNKRKKCSSMLHFQSPSRNVASLQHRKSPGRDPCCPPPSELPFGQCPTFHLTLLKHLGYRMHTIFQFTMFSRLPLIPKPHS